MALTLTPLPEVRHLPGPKQRHPPTCTGPGGWTCKEKQEKSKKRPRTVEQAEDSLQTTPSEPASDEAPAEPDAPAEDPADMPRLNQSLLKKLRIQMTLGHWKWDTSGSSSGGNDLGSVEGCALLWITRWGVQSALPHRPTHTRWRYHTGLLCVRGLKGCENLRT